jgi:hypothetical protein
VPELTSYAAAWRAYRWWSRAFWLTFVAYLPAMALVDRILRRTDGDAANNEMFFRIWDDRPWRKTWQSNPFARRCRHCGLPKWSNKEDG